MPATALLCGDPVEVAPRLLGARITSRSRDGKEVTIRLTEVEAYRGESDPGSHAFRGRTARNASMFETAGTVYVYFTYGMHHCVNLVCWPQDRAGAVLLRGGEVIKGLDLARTRRPAARADRDLARGPARLCAALGLTRSDDGIRLGSEGDRLRLVLPEPGEAPKLQQLRSGPRTGVAGLGGDARHFPWRFWLDGETTVSAYRPAVKHPRTR